MLAHEARVRHEVDLVRVGYELHLKYGLPDLEIIAARTLGDFALSVAYRLRPAADREARATEIVTETARRVAPALLGEAGSSTRL
jgi:hypothetical protein